MKNPPVLSEPAGAARRDDPVDHPRHYTFADPAYEVIRVIEAWKLCYHLGNVIKYIVRSGKKTKDPLEDLKKARWYLDRHINSLEKQDVGTTQ